MIWDSHPLALGATPAQVFIDGIAQLESPYVAKKPEAFQSVPKVPNFDKEAKEAVKYDGLPPLTPAKKSAGLVAFVNVKTVFTRSSGAVQRVMDIADRTGVVVAREGRVVCSGLHAECFSPGVLGAEDPLVIDLEGGSISPSLVSFGAPLGLEEIAAESSTGDGVVLDPLQKAVPAIIGGDSAIIRAVDGLQYSTRDALYAAVIFEPILNAADCSPPRLAYRSGVTAAITAPSAYLFYSGIGTYFSTGAENKLQTGAILKEVTGLHLAVRHFGVPSVSTQIAALRRLLLRPDDGASGQWFKKVVQVRWAVWR